MQRLQRQEFAIRAAVQSPEAILRSLYDVNRAILKDAPIGRLAPGMAGDVVLTPVNPLERIAGLAAADAVTQVVQGGELVL